MDGLITIVVLAYGGVYTVLVLHTLKRVLLEVVRIHALLAERQHLHLDSKRQGVSSSFSPSPRSSPPLPVSEDEIAEQDLNARIIQDSRLCSDDLRRDEELAYLEEQERQRRLRMMTHAPRGVS